MKPQFLWDSGSFYEQMSGISKFSEIKIVDITGLKSKCMSYYHVWMWFPKFKSPLGVYTNNSGSFLLHLRDNGNVISLFEVLFEM